MVSIGDLGLFWGSWVSLSVISSCADFKSVNRLFFINLEESSGLIINELTDSSPERGYLKSYLLS